MKGFTGILALAFTGVIIADLITHWPGVVAGVQSANNLLATTYTAMLGNVPSTQQQWPVVR